MPSRNPSLNNSALEGEATDEGLEGLGKNVPSGALDYWGADAGGDIPESDLPPASETPVPGGADSLIAKLIQALASKFMGKQ